ncbi:MAG: polysaccharide biosynthesis/export family protein [Candidatus Tantalella remota]|nr:polysaccharide biosynthesis/export family protein [Candidatus Tantalella remota]
MRALKLTIQTMVLTSILVSTCGLVHAAQKAESAKAIQSDYQIGPENVLQIDVYYGKEEGLERKARVSANGYITFPLLGEIKLSGLTVSEAETLITELLAKDYFVNPQVSIFIKQYSTVSILGQVEEPGAYEIKGRLTVVELISKAGGFTKLAHTNNVWVIRTKLDGTKKKMQVKVNDIINKGKEEDDIRLQPGDIVTVSESFF